MDSLEAMLLMLRLRFAGVTTILCVCVAVQTELDVQRFQAAATLAGFGPEWFFDTSSRMFRSTWHRSYTDQTHPAFGITPEWVLNDSEYAYRAYQSVRPGGTPNVRFRNDIYHGFMALFVGIQGAGPRLTPDALERGMRTWSLNESSAYDPFGGPFGDNPFTFRRSALAWRWEPSIAGLQGRGCLRTYGHVAIDGEWHDGDDDLDGGGFCMKSHEEA